MGSEEAQLPELRKSVSVLEARLRTLEDVEEIRRLKARYSELTDKRYGRRGPVDRPELDQLADEIASLFTADAIWDGGKVLGLCEGRDKIRDRFAQPTLRFSIHYFLNAQIHVSADDARARWEILSPCTTQDGKPHWMAGSEADEYRRQNGRWLHSRMKLEVAFLAPHETGWVR